MNRKWLLAGLALLMGAPLGAVAQEPQRERDREREDVFRVFSWNDNRGRIGVIVSVEADASTDRLGARIEGVTPGGPADRGGLKAGDIITKLNGTTLGGFRAEQSGESGPGRKLLELARALEPGDTVRIEYRRGNDSKTATIVAEDLGWSGLMRMRPGEPFGPMAELRVAPQLEDAQRSIEVALSGIGSPWAGVEFVTLDPDLGEYFGVSEGLLVLKVRSDSGMPLKAGDVILAFDGRKPTSPSHALRILRSYEPGETVSLEIQRKQRRQTVSWVVPESSVTRSRVPRPPRAPRAPRPERSEQG